MWKAACQNWSSPSSPSSNLPKNILWKSNKAKYWGISMSEQAEPLPQSEMPLPGEVPFPVRAEPVEASPAGGTPLDSPLLGSDPSTGSGGTESVGKEIDTQQLKRVLEAALLTSSEPLPLAELKKLSDAPLDNRQLEALLEELMQDWQGRGVELSRVANGWRFRAKPEMQQYLD